MKVTGLTLGLMATSIIAPNVLSKEGVVAHADSLSSIKTVDYDNLDRKQFENEIDISSLRQLIVKSALEEINATRNAMGIKSLEVGNDVVQAMTYKHSRYMAIEEDYAHNENKKTSQYFTGATFSDRVDKLGSFQNSYDMFTEDIVYSDTWETSIVTKYMLQKGKYNEELFVAFIKDEIRSLYNAPYHGATMLAPYMAYANADMYTDKNIKHLAIGMTLYTDEDIYDTDVKELSKPYFYPYNGQTGAITYMKKGSENPDPVVEAGLTVSGTPLIAYNYTIYNSNNRYEDTAQVKTATLTNTKTGKTVATKKIGQDKMSSNMFSLFMPVTKLDPYTMYKVVYTYNVPNGIYSSASTKEYTVTFTTGADTDSVENIVETSDTVFTYKGKTYDMSTYKNTGAVVEQKPTTPTTPTTPVATNVIKTTDTSKLATALKEAKTQFTDFKTDQYWADAVVWMYANGIMNGSDTTKKIAGTNKYYRQFMPNSNLTEIQMLAMLFRYTANDSISKFPASTSDYGVVYYNMAKSMGLATKGDAGTNRSKGNLAITREEMAILFTQALTGKKMTGKDAIQYLYNNNISTGNSATRTISQTTTNKDGSMSTKKVTETYSPKTYDSFDPKGKLTRAHVSAFFYRTQQQVEAGKIQINKNF